MNILILGADGYLGWSLTKKLDYEGHELTLVDSGLRRKLVDSINSNSLTKIKKLDERIKLLNNIKNSYMVDITNFDEIIKIFTICNPDIVINCAQQASAPYSMKSVSNANFTLINNEVGNMNVLWAIKEKCPKALYIKLGSFGEYAPTNIEVSEGYF